MVLDTKEQILSQIAKLLTKIQKETKIGTAYEKYDTRYLWSLGDEIHLYFKVAKNKEDIIEEILIYLNESGLSCTPVLLKNAETARRRWKNESDYLRDVNGASYGKLKAILPIIDPDFSSQVAFPDQEIKALLSALNTDTYEEVLEKVRRLRRIYDTANLSMDIDQFYSDLHSMNSYLEKAVTEHDTKTLDYVRTRYPSKLINNIRMLIASLQSEEALQRIGPSLPKIEKTPEDLMEIEIDVWFSNIINVLVTLKRGSLSSRERVRHQIGISKLGELSTLLKAASSDEELSRYRRGQELLEKIRNPYLPRNATDTDLKPKK